MLFNRLKYVRSSVLLGFWILLWMPNTFSQQNEIVWYFNTKQKSEISNIKSILDGLEGHSANSPFFTNTIYLNSLQNTEEEEFEIRKQLDRFAESGFFARDNSSGVNRALFNKLLGFHYFLQIELEANAGFREKEFTFSLYKAIPGQVIDAKEVELATLDLQSLKIENAKINIENSSEQIQTALKNAIKRLFPQLNAPPIAIINVNEQNVNTYYNTLDREVKLDAFYSSDEDTKRANFSFKWRQIALNGSINIPPRKRIALDDNAEASSYILPDTGVYKLGLIVHDGIENSIEDTITIINFNSPKILLSKHELRDRRKISIFQALNFKKNSKKIKEQLTLNISSEIPLNYTLRYFKHWGRTSNAIQIEDFKNAPNNFQVNFEGNLKFEEIYQYGFYGAAGDITTDTSYFNLRQSKRVFSRISIGLEYFLGASILCAEPLNGPIWVVAPTSIMGGLYLLHDRGVSLLLEGGVLIFWRESFADRVANGFGLGKMALKITTDFPKLAPYFALQVIGGPAKNATGKTINRQHFGFVFGSSLFNNKLDIDMLNMYYNFGDSCYTLSGGIRYNFGKF